MKDYQVYIFDSGHVNATHVVTAKDDDDAVEQARQKFLGVQDIQIWQERRFVTKLYPSR